MNKEASRDDGAATVREAKRKGLETGADEIEVGKRRKGEPEAEVGAENAVETASGEAGGGLRDAEAVGEVGVGAAGGEARKGEGKAGGRRKTGQRA